MKSLNSWKYIYEYFTLYQNELLKIVNTPMGRSILSCEIDGKIVQIFPFGYHITIGHNRFIARFFPTFHLVNILIPLLDKIHIANESYKISINQRSVEHFFGNHLFFDLPNVYLSTQTFDDLGGSGRIASSHSTYATAYSGNNLSVSSMTQHIWYYNGSLYVLERFFLPFDTSSLPDTAIIESAFVRYVNASGGGNNADSESLVVVASTQASVTTLDTSDWTNLGSTSFGSKTLASWNTANGANNDIALNGTGLSNISLTGNTKFAVRFQRDINNTAPTGDNSAAGLNSGAFILSVTYTDGPTWPILTGKKFWGWRYTA